MKSDYYRELIESLDSGTLSPEAKNAVRCWLEQERNEGVDGILEQIWSQEIPVDRTASEHALQRLYARLGEDTAARPAVKRRRHLRILGRVAAAAVLVAVSFFAANHLLKDKYEETILSELYVSNGDLGEMTLADGSRTKMNSGSILVFPEEFRAPQRVVYLSGEALFDVERNPDVPFIVRTSQFDIEVLGTKFNLEAYPDNDSHRATLIEGSVNVNIRADGRSFTLRPGQQFIYDRATGKCNLQDADLDNVTAWTKGQIIFRDATIGDIFSTLERRYNVEFQYNSKRLSRDRYNIRFAPDADLEEALSVLNILIGPFTYKITDQTYTIHWK